MDCEVSCDNNGNISPAQSSRLADLSATLLPTTRDGRSLSDCASAAELSSYRSALRRILFIGKMSHSFMLAHASMMACRVNTLKVGNPRQLQGLIKLDKSTAPTLRFASPASPGKFSSEAIFDAAISSIAEGGSPGAHIIFRRCGDLIHPLYRTARKLRRVACSSSTAELLAASDAASRLVYLQVSLAESFYTHRAQLQVDSPSLLNFATSTREPTEALNKVDVASIREDFRPTEVSSVAWIRRHYDLSDSLTKDNRQTAALLNKEISDGLLPPHPDTNIQEAEAPFA